MQGIKDLVMDGRLVMDRGPELLCYALHWDGLAVMRYEMFETGFNYLRYGTREETLRFGSAHQDSQHGTRKSQIVGEGDMTLRQLICHSSFIPSHVFSIISYMNFNINRLSTNSIDVFPPNPSWYPASSLSQILFPPIHRGICDGVIRTMSPNAKCKTRRAESYIRR
jgi:hypothetical protein